MNSKRKRTYARAEAYGPPIWLLDALDMLRLFETETEEAPSEFLDRCRPVASPMFVVAKLRRAHEHGGFIPVPLSDYLRRLSKASKVRLEPLLEHVGIRSLAEPHTLPTSALVRLGKLLGFSARELILHLRIELAATLGFSPMPLLAMHRAPRRTHRDPYWACERLLREFESSPTYAHHSTLRRMDNEIRLAYDNQIDTQDSR